MTSAGEPYVIEATGWQRLVLFAARFMGLKRPARLLLIDSVGIHWPNSGGKPDFVLGWDEITEIIRQRYMRSWCLFIMVKDVDAAIARHPMKAMGPLVKQFGPSPFAISSYLAPLDELIRQIHRFSAVPVRDGNGKGGGE